MVHDHDIVYVVDPDEAVHDALTTLLRAAGFGVICHRTAEEFFDSGATRTPMRGVLLTEAELPGMGSLAFLRRLRAQGLGIPVVVLANTFDRDIARQVLKAGAVEVIEKPLVHDRLLNRLRELALEREQVVTQFGRPGSSSA